VPSNVRPNSPQNFMLFSRSVANVTWQAYFTYLDPSGLWPGVAYRTLLKYQHDKTFAMNAEALVHLMFAVGEPVSVVDDRERIDSQQGWKLKGRANETGSGDPDAVLGAASMCSELVWLHKIKMGTRMSEIWSLVKLSGPWEALEIPELGKAWWPRQNRYCGKDISALGRSAVARLLRSNRFSFFPSHPTL